MRSRVDGYWIPRARSREDEVVHPPAARPAQAYVTYALVIVNVVVFLVGVALGGASVAFDGGLFSSVYAETHRLGAILRTSTAFLAEDGNVIGTYDGVADGAWYRLLTGAFVHFGVIHLAVNTATLLGIGGYLEHTLGRLRFLSIYVLSGLSASLAAILTSGPHELTAGASGAIFGLLGTLPFATRRPGYGRLLAFAAVNVALTFVPGVSLAMHAAGAVTGAATALATSELRRDRRPARRE